ncbi:uncharacterized protein LOC109713910 [Ananas comosus]|uniref:Uncharacterized protein LOC109713910 n=1 Tax=Ananas comosus TaxID=4615 RepID=A0A6P5FC30_ANACO|nr:uncharacterized protein LOC109713910 [Ananas comosus]
MSEAGEVVVVAAAAVEKLCRRCKRRFDPSKNTPSSCSFHPSFFVCRRHDDQKRYYELGPDDPPYAAKFYDCCGAEDPDAPDTSQCPSVPSHCLQGAATSQT